MKLEHATNDTGRKVTVVSKDPTDLTVEERLADLRRRIEALEKKPK